MDDPILANTPYEVEIEKAGNDYTFKITNMNTNTTSIRTGTSTTPFTTGPVYVGGDMPGNNPAIPETFKGTISKVQFQPVPTPSDYIFSTSGQRETTTNYLYSLEADSGASLSQELTGFPDIGTVPEWNIKVYFTIPNNHTSSFNLFNTNRTPVGSETVWQGDILVSVQGSTMYVTYYKMDSGYQERVMSGVIAAETKDYELSLERVSVPDQRLKIKLTNVTDNTVTYTGHIGYMYMTWSALVGAPAFVGGTSRSNAAGHSAPNAGQLITKVEVGPSTTTTNVLGVKLPTMDLKVGSTYNFTIDPDIATTDPFFITTSSTGGQDAIDNSIHSESEVTINGDTISFTPTQARTLYYQSGSHTNVGGTINVTYHPANSIEFKPTQARTLYYHSGSDVNMGGVINVTAAPVVSSGGSSGGSSGATNFLDLTDTPSSLTANKFLAVNTAGNAIELVDGPSGGGESGGSGGDITTRLQKTE